MKLWEIYAELGIDTSKYDSQIDEAIKKAQTLNDTLSGVGASTSGTGTNAASVAVGNLASQAITRGLSDLVDVTGKSIDLASHKGEVQNVVNQVFGSVNASMLEVWAKSAKEQFGLGSVRAKEYAGQFGSMFSAAGIAEDEVYSMSTDLTRLAGDIASFHDQSFDTVYGRLYSAMTGQARPLRGYGVDMTVKNMEAFAQSQGYSGKWNDLSSAEQYALRYDYIMANTKAQQGDFQRTLPTSMANQRRLAEENIAELQTSYGESFLDVVTGGYKAINSLFGTSAPALSDTLDAYDNAQKSTQENLAQTARDADSLIGILAEMEGQTSRTAEEQLRWDSALRTLSTNVPGMADLIDLTNGSINGGTEALREHREAWLADSMAAAEAVSQLGKLEALANAEKALADSQVGYRVAQEGAESSFSEVLKNAQSLSEMMAAYDQLDAGAYFDKTEQSARKLLSTFNDMPGWYNGAEFAGLSESLAASLAAYDDSTGKAKAMDEQVKSLTSQIESARGELGFYNTSLSGVVDQTSATIEGLNQSDAAYQNGLSTALGYAAGLGAGMGSVQNAADALRRAGNPGRGTAVDDVDGSHAAGLSYVPFDDYKAYLHRGESVLTRQDAEEWRSGVSGRITRADLDAMADRIVAGVASMSLNMDGKAVGRIVSQTVSEMIAKETRNSRRYKA